MRWLFVLARKVRRARKFELQCLCTCEIRIGQFLERFDNAAARYNILPDSLMYQYRVMLPMVDAWSGPVRGNILGQRLAHQLNVIIGQPQYIVIGSPTHYRTNMNTMKLS